MKIVLFVLLITLLSGCTGSLKFGSDGATFTPDPTTKANFEAIAKAVNALDASIKNLNERILKLEPKPSPSPAPQAKVISKNTVK